MVASLLEYTTDIHKHKCEEPQQKNGLGMVSNKFLGVEELKHVLLDPALACSFCNFSKHLVRMKVSMG